MNKDLQIIIDTLKNELKSSVLSCDLWLKNDKSSVIDYNNSFEFSSNFGDIINDFEKKLDFLGLPMLGDYALYELEIDTLLLFVNLGKEYVLGSLIDKTTINVTSLIVITIPKIIKIYNNL